MSAKLKYVMRATPTLHYFRHEPTFGHELIPLGEVGSPEYLERHKGLLAQVMAGKTKPLPKAVIERAVEYLPGSLGWLVPRFKKSKTYLRKKQGTRDHYGPLLDAIVQKFGGCPINQMRRSDVRKMCDQFAKERSDSVADMIKRLLSSLWKFARDIAECKIDEDASNPARDHEARYEVEQEHLPWPDHVQALFLDGDGKVPPADVELRKLHALALYTGQRRGDLSRMREQHIDHHGVLHILGQEKTGAHVSIPVIPELRKALDAAPPCADGFLLPWRSKGTLTKVIKARLIAVGCGQYTLHGLRKSAATMLAENEGTHAELMYVFGWKTEKMATYYIRKAKGLKIGANAMAKMERAVEAIKIDRATFGPDLGATAMSKMRRAA